MLVLININFCNLDIQSEGDGKSSAYCTPYLQKVYGYLEDLPLKDLLIVLLGPEGRRKLLLRQLVNDELFLLYVSDLALRIRHDKKLRSIRQLLTRLKIPQRLPAIPRVSIEALLDVKRKRTHKKVIPRDTLLVEVKLFQRFFIAVKPEFSVEPLN